MPDALGIQTAQEGEQACWEERCLSLNQLVPLDKRGAFNRQDLPPDIRVSHSLAPTRRSYPKKILALLAKLSLALLGHHNNNRASKLVLLAFQHKLKGMAICKTKQNLHFMGLHLGYFSTLEQNQPKQLTTVMLLSSTYLLPSRLREILFLITGLYYIVCCREVEMEFAIKSSWHSRPGNEAASVSADRDRGAVNKRHRGTFMVRCFSSLHTHTRGFAQGQTT